MKETTTLTHVAKQTDAPLFDRLMKHADIESEAARAKAGLSWSTLTPMPGSIRNAIASVAVSALEKVRILKAYNFLDPETDSVSKTLANDIMLIGDTVDEIEKKHIGRGGRSKSPQEDEAITAIYDEYNELNNRYRANVSPALLNITERMQLLISEINAGRIKEIK